MKHKQFATISMALILLLCAVACNPFDRNGRTIMNYAFSGNNSRVVINDNDMSLEINYSGDIAFNDEETAIAKMSPGSYLDYRKNGKRLFAEAKSNGDVVYEFYNNDKQSNEENAGKKFLVDAIHEMIAQGMFIKGRMERLYQEGGVPLILAEVKRTRADHVRRMYLEFLLKTDSLSQDEMTDISNIIGKTISSDDDKRKILEKVPVAYLKDTMTSQAYFAAIETINSDNDKANALKKTLKEPLSVGEFNLLVRVATTINSDNDKANLLRDLIHNGTVAEESYDGLLEAINSINSDNDKANVLKTLVENQIYPGEQFQRLLDVMGKINSDNDKANVFKKLAEQNITLEEQWVALIDKAATISSDNDKANVLVAISKKMPRSEVATAAFMKSSKTLNSDSDYKRAVKSVQ